MDILQEVIDYIETSKTTTIGISVFMLMCIPMSLMISSHRNELDTISARHKEQLSQIKNGLCDDLRITVGELNKNRDQIINEIEEHKVGLVKTENYNKYYNETVPTSYIKETISSLEIDVKYVDDRIKDTRNQISRCDTRPERQLSRLLGNI